MKRECGNCAHINTPKTKVQCYTLTKALKDIDPFIPEKVIPIMDKLAKDCKRYKPRK